MLSLASTVVGEKSLGEDIVQESLIKALSSIDRFQNRSSIKTWLHRITVNNAISQLRKMKRLSEESLNEHQPEFDSMACRNEAKWGPLRDPETMLAQRHTREKIEQAFHNLPESHALIVRLRDLMGYDTKEVADMLAISEVNVKVRLHRARSALKTILEPVLRNEEI